MSEMEEKLVCTWCQSEIIWDPEIGPETECPHCFSELGDYRSIKLNVKPHVGRDLNVDLDDVDLDDTDLDDVDLDDFDVDEEDEFIYSEELHALEDLNEFVDQKFKAKVTECLDAQEEAPECWHCQELMIFTGTYKADANRFVEEIPAALGVPFLTAPFSVKLYLCPSCYEIKTFLSSEDRLAITKTIHSSF